MPPRILIVFVLAVLALLHAYVGVRLIGALPLPSAMVTLAWGFLGLSFVLFPLGLITSRIDHHPLADPIAWLSYTVMGLTSSLLVLTVLRDLGLLALTLTGIRAPGFVADSALAVPLIALVVTALGLANARRLARVVDIDIPLANLPAALEGFRIAQISDLHVGPTIKRNYLEKVVARVNALQPDMVAITGDLVDGSVAALGQHTAPIAQLRSRHGSFFVTGNHEYYAHAHPWIAEIRRLGLTVLMNEHVLLEHDGAHLVVAGVTDYTAHLFDPSHRSDPRAAAAGAPSQVPKLLLAHQPRTAAAAAEAGFDLQLSGHTHGGQFLPWNLFVPLQQPFTAGLHRLQQLSVYVSRGTGYWGPPKRFGAPSEITCLRLVNATPGAMPA